LPNQALQETPKFGVLEHRGTLNILAKPEASANVPIDQKSF
jgi:hypothetical protein